MKYLLDTNICVYFLNQNTKIANKIATFSDNELAISCFSLAELLFGAYNSKHIEKIWNASGTSKTPLKFCRLTENPLNTLPK